MPPSAPSRTRTRARSRSRRPSSAASTRRWPPSSASPPTASRAPRRRRRALLESTDAAAAARIVDSSGIVQAVAVSPDRRLLAAVGADGTLRLWNVAAPGHATPVGQPLQPANSRPPALHGRVQPDGKVLAAAGAGQEVKLWDVSNPARPVPLGAPLTGPSNTIYSVVFSPDGRTLAAASADDTVRLWNVTDPARARPLGRPLTGPTGYVQTVAFSADGGLLAAGSGNSEAGAARRHRLGVERRRPGPPAAAARHAADRAGRRWCRGWRSARRAACWPRPARTTRSGCGRSPRRPGRARRHAGQLDELGEHGRVQPVRRLPGGRDVGSPGAGLEHGHPRADRDHGLPQPVTTVAWDGAGRVAAADADGTASIWTLPSPVLLAGNASASVAYAPDGTTMAVGGTSLELWSAASRTLIASRPLPGGSYVNGVAFAPSGDYLAVAYGNGTAQLLDAPDAGGGEQAVLGDDQAGPSNRWRTAPTARRSPPAPTTGPCGSGRSPTRRTPGNCPAVHDSGDSVYTIAFAPNGRTLAATSVDDFTRLWNVADPAPPGASRQAARRPARIRDRAWPSPPAAACSRSAARTAPSTCGTFATPPAPPRWARR